MPRIELHTIINAEIETVFDLSRSVDLHITSTQHTKEKVIAGKTTGLLELNDSVTWNANHLGFNQNLTSKITKFERPQFFEDKMVKGAFKSFKHEHHFSTEEGKTKMTDIFVYESPLGLLGKAADALFLNKYITKLLTKRNKTIKEFAESEKWKTVLNSN